MKRYRIIKVAYGERSSLGSVQAESPEEALAWAYRNHVCNPVGVYGDGHCFEVEEVRL